MSVDTIDYGEGRKLQAGWVTTDQIPVGIDTYYPGMLLEFQKAGTAITTGTGDGVASAIIANAVAKSGVYTCTFTAALIFDFSDPDGNVLAVGLTVPDGGAATFKIGGVTFTLTDGAAAWIATDTIAITVAITGLYVALEEGSLDAIYNAEERTFASTGVADAIMGGEIDESGLVSDADVALVLNEVQRAAYRSSGFFIKRV